MEQPSYYSVTPATVRYDHRLKPNEKLLYGEITALANVKGYCYASNSYFAKLYGVKSGTVSGWVAHLKEFGYIDTQTIYKENSKEIQERRIYINDTPTRNIAGVCDKNRIPPTIKNEDPMRYKSKENNTSINNTSKNMIDRQIAGISKITKFKEFWEKNLGMVAPFILEDFAYEYWDWVDKGVDHDEIIKIFIKALSGAISYGANDKRTYTLRILHNWLNNNILSINAIEGEEKQFKAKKQQRQNSNSYTSKTNEAW